MQCPGMLILETTATAGLCNRDEQQMICGEKQQKSVPLAYPWENPFLCMDSCSAFTPAFGFVRAEQ